MPPKKKKTQLKPVARGFATTSVPKKVVPVVEDPLPEVPTDTGDTSSAAQHAAGPKESTADGGTVEEFSLEKVEEQALQNIVDKLQEKTEKEINRTIKVSHRY
jgi:ATP-dependent RNA helicase DHX29